MLTGQMLCVNLRLTKGEDMRAGDLKEEQDLNRPRLGVGAVDGWNRAYKCIWDCRYNISFTGTSGSCRTKGVSICYGCPSLFWGPNESLRKESQK